MTISLDLSISEQACLSLLRSARNLGSSNYLRLRRRISYAVAVAVRDLLTDPGQEKEWTVSLYSYDPVDEQAASVLAEALTGKVNMLSRVKAALVFGVQWPHVGPADGPNQHTNLSSF